MGVADAGLAATVLVGRWGRDLSVEREAVKVPVG
jgi:hypothetical protein